MIKVADAGYNAGQVIACVEKAREQGVKVLVFPELTLTGCSCYDLFQHSVLLRGAEKALLKVVEATEGVDMLIFVGLPGSPPAPGYTAVPPPYTTERFWLWCPARMFAGQSLRRARARYCRADAGRRARAAGDGHSL